MIENGVITHGFTESPLYSWRIDSFFFNAFLITVLTTVLSYQATSIVSHLLLGLKPRGRTTASDVHTLLLADESSPLTVTAAVLRWDALDRKRLHNDIPKSTKIARQDASVSRLAVLKLLVILVAAPLINLAAVILSLERNEHVSLTEAELGGLALMVDADAPTLNHTIVNDLCTQISTKLPPDAEEGARFFQCTSTAASGEKVSGSEPFPRLSLRTTVRGEIIFSHIPADSDYPGFQPFWRTFDVVTREGSFRVRPVLLPSKAKEFLNKEKQLFEQECPPESRFEPTPISESYEDIVEANGLQAVFVGVNCAFHNLSMRAVTFQPFNESVVVRPTEKLEVLKHDELPQPLVSPKPLEWLDGANLTLITRRRPYVPPAVLGILVLVVVCLRLLTQCAVNHDIYDGILEILSSQLGKSIGESMRSNQKVRYNLKFQTGEKAHYGVERIGLTSVQEFHGGVVGIL